MSDSKSYLLTWRMLLRLKSYNKRNDIFLRHPLNSTGLQQSSQTVDIKSKCITSAVITVYQIQLRCNFLGRKKETPQGNLFPFGYFVPSSSFWHARISAFSNPIKWINCSGVVPRNKAFLIISCLSLMRPSVRPSVRPFSSP